MGTATILSLLGLCLGFGSALILLFSADRLLNVLAKASSPTVVSVGRGPDMNAISQLGQDVRDAATYWHRRVRIGVLGLFVSFVFQVVALFL